MPSSKEKHPHPMASTSLKLLSLLILVGIFLYLSNGPSLIVVVFPSLKSYWVEYQPRHVHLSLGPSTSSLLVTWSTLDPTPNPTLLLTKNSKVVKYKGSSKIFIDGGKEKRKQWIHKVELDGLAGNTEYKYVVGSELGWSDVFYTTTLPHGDDWPLTLALYGDLGNENVQSLPTIQRKAEEGVYQALIHVGDIAYDMYEQNGRVGDAFMEQIEPIASVIPYMTCPGNHENHYNFSNYKARFNMPGDTDNNNMFYSFNIANVHFVSVSTEYYYYLNYGHHQIAAQYSWLKEDLAKANSPKGRQAQPWVVVFGHRPMYCSGKSDHQACQHERTRTGVTVGNHSIKYPGLEDLLYQHGVDLTFWAHEHNYERLWPTYNLTVYNGTQAPYTDPGAPVHITTGSPGNREGRDPFLPEVNPWSAFRSTDYGFTEMTVHNKSHVHIQQISTDQGGKVIDQLWIVKNKHGAYSSL